jgi:hypothetical protein
LSNGNPWVPDRHDPILKAWAGRITDKEIGTITGHGERTIRDRRNAMGLPAYVNRPACMTRRDYLLAGAAGLWENATCQP